MPSSASSPSSCSRHPGLHNGLEFCGAGCSAAAASSTSSEKTIGGAEPRRPMRPAATTAAAPLRRLALPSRNTPSCISAGVAPASSSDGPLTSDALLTPGGSVFCRWMAKPVCAAAGSGDGSAASPPGQRKRAAPVATTRRPRSRCKPLQGLGRAARAPRVSSERPRLHSYLAARGRTTAATWLVALGREGVQRRAVEREHLIHAREQVHGRPLPPRRREASAREITGRSRG